jgi:hypothetical protein
MTTPDDVPVTIATFPNPFEAELARAALDSQGIPAIVNHDHGQYVSAGSWVQVQVARGQSELAASLLESGPLHGSEGTVEPDDMGQLRVQRRFTLARWLLYAGAVQFLLTGLLLPLSLVALGLAAWSLRNPRRAFGIAFALQAVVVLVAVAASGPTGLVFLIPLVAFYFAWASAAPTPEPSLAASSPPRMRSIDIGDAWRAEDVPVEPIERPIWILRDLGVFLLAALVIFALTLALRAG